MLSQIYTCENIDTEVNNEPVVPHLLCDKELNLSNLFPKALLVIFHTAAQNPRKRLTRLLEYQVQVMKCTPCPRVDHIPISSSINCVQRIGPHCFQITFPLETTGIMGSVEVFFRNNFFFKCVVGYKEMYKKVRKYEQISNSC